MYRSASLILGLLLAIPQLACAGVRTSSSGGVSIQLEDEHGQRLRTYTRRGATYVLGHTGRRYNVRVFNGTNQRLETVITVDGRDVISGNIGDYEHQRGYVINPYDSVLVEGFRQSMTNVAAFRFTSPGDSYAGRRGTAHHVGVIGVAVFQEKTRQQTFIPLQRPPVGSTAPHPHSAPESSASLGTTGFGDSVTPRESGSLGSRGAKKGRASRSKSRNRLGTRYGETRQSEAVAVPFERQNGKRPLHILAMYYDDHSGLSSRGIRVSPPHGGEPTPFPSHSFAPPPF